MTYPERMIGKDSLTGAEFALLEARYPGKEITVELEINYYKIYADDELVAKEILLEDALREALT